MAAVAEGGERAALSGRAAIQANDLVEAMYDAGLAALPIVTIVSLLVGGILAFIGATELSKLGAGVFVADLVGIGMVREMAALMTAIIMAARTGGADAANIASMESGEEIDARRAMGHHRGGSSYRIERCDHERHRPMGRASIPGNYPCPRARSDQTIAQYGH
jgi:ABC-type transporter Mla maintaining outer membrane lipid asymmetry permease subunit MlaE